MVANVGEQCTGGRGGIRTHGTLAGTPVFKTGALNHSATLPLLRHQPSSARKIKNGLATGPIGPENTRPTPRCWLIGPSPGGGIGASQSLSGGCTLVASGAITCLWPGV